MVSSARQTITCILFVLGIAISIQAQNGSISGKVTIKGKPASGVTILATDSEHGSGSIMSRHRARTDQTGSYRITNLPAGTYDIASITPSLVPANDSDSVVVTADEQVENFNIVLVPGGVITGKITDHEGEPVIGQQVIISPVSEQPHGFRNTMLSRFMENSTDDRGVYRAFGLPPGKYKVSVGESGSGRRSSREYYKKTFFRSVTDAAKATIIEVTEGSVTNDVDIVLGRPVETFRVAGRVIDGETGKPVPNLKFGVGQKTLHDQYSSMSSSDVTNANGEFLLSNVSPGTYTIFTAPAEGSAVPAASVTFDVVDRDLTDLLIKTTQGSSLSGVVVLEGNESVKLSGLRIYAFVASPESQFGNSPASVVGADGSFSINGVRTGLASLSVYSSGDNSKNFEIIRVERNGIPSETINVKESEHVAGIRVVLKSVKLTGAIRGQLQVENGALPPISQLSLMLWPLDENLERKRTSSIESPRLDARGHFFAERLPAGTYELSVYVYGPGRRTTEEKTQQVTVTDDAVTDVTLIIKPQPTP